MKEVKKQAKDYLIPANKRSKLEASELGRRGGIKSGKVRKEKKQVKELLKMLLSTQASQIHKTKIQKTFPNVDLKTLEDILNLAMIKEGAKGNVQAYNAIYDRIEGKPQNKTDITTQGDKISFENISTDELIKRAEAIKTIEKKDSDIST